MISQYVIKSAILNPPSSIFTRFFLESQKKPKSKRNSRKCKKEKKCKTLLVLEGGKNYVQQGDILLSLVK